MEADSNDRCLIPVLSDKDYQLVSKTFRKISELYYENPQNKEPLDNLICIASLVPMIVPSKISTNGLTIMSQMEILKAKVKNVPNLTNQLSQAVIHIRNPSYVPMKSELLVQTLKNSQLFTLGCTIMLRYFDMLRQDHSLDWSSVIDSLGQRIYECPHLSIDVLNEICKDNQQNVRLIAKSGLFQYISTIYISENIKDKFHLYRALKLIRSAAAAGSQVIRDRENTLAIILLTYEQYAPIVSDIFLKCYEEEYCCQVIKKDIYGDNINYVYGWSFSESFCQHQLNPTIINKYIDTLQKQAQSGEFQTKVFTILSNYCKFCKVGDKDLLKSNPHYQQSLLSYFKLCLNMSEILPSAPYLINWNQLNDLLTVNTNPKVTELAKYLKDLTSKEVKVGSLSGSLKKMFSSEKNAEIMLERGSKVPKNNEQLQQLKDILSQKQRSNEHDSDTLRMAKQKAIQSLKEAIAHQTKLDINSILKAIQLDDVYLLSKLLQAVELYLIIFEEAADTIDKGRILQIIRWIQDHYKGEIIDWGSISQLLITLVQENQWKKQMKTFPNYCFWFLSIDVLSKNDEKELWNAVKTALPEKMNKKMPLLLGFLGRSISKMQKVQYLKNHKAELLSLVSNLAKNYDYQLNAMMLSFFLRGWGQEDEDYQPDKHRKIFEQFIAPIDSILSSHLHLIPQDYFLLESCLPYKIHFGKKAVTDLQSLIRSNGKLASYIYQQEGSQGKKKISGPIVSLNSSNVESLHQTMIFSQNYPNFIKANEINSLVNHISESSKSYWEMYPRYSDIMGNLIKVLGSSENENIQVSLTDLCQKLISQIVLNPNITDDERQQLLQQVRDSFENMKQRGVYIQIERIKRIVTKIVEKEIRDEIIIILNNYKIKENQKIQIKMLGEKQAEEQIDSSGKVELGEKYNEGDRSGMAITQSTVMLINQPGGQEEAYSSIMPMEKQFQSVKQSNSSQLVSVFQTLKKIVNKELPFEKFHEISPVLQQNNLNEQEKQLLGSLLVQLYHQNNHPTILKLLLDKDKTIVCKEKIFQLVSTYIPAFALSRRWKLISREYLDIAMARINQGFLGDACQVAQHNVVKTGDLEYFYSKKYHIIVSALIESFKEEEQIAHLLALIGMAARFPQIKKEWVEQKLHLKIFKFISFYPKSIKVIGNLCFALSSLTFEENGACADIVKQTERIYLMLDSLLFQPSNSLIAQYGSLFLGNLSFSKCFDSNLGFDIQKVIKVMLAIFEANLEAENLNCYKHLLKGLGNMSMIPGCSSMILNEKLCNNMVTLAEKIDIFTYYDEKKGKFIKLLLDLITNLATHRELTKLEIFHKSKISLLTVTLLETIETTHTELIASCIDSIDAICQDPILENWYVSQKKLPSILLDIIKLQSQDKLLVKSVRLITNLTLHQNCIPHILRSNILSVFANIVIPQLRAISSSNQQTSQKIETYILKIILRIFQTKPKQELNLILKSGYLDCLVRLMEMTDLDEKFLDVLFCYSPHIPNFLNKRAFSSIIKILTLKVNNQQILIKCLQSLKNILSFTYDVEEQDNIIDGIPEMYIKFLSTEFTMDALFLLCYHLMRSHQFRQAIKKPDCKLQHCLRILAKDDSFTELCRTIFFLIYTGSSKQLFLDQNQGEQLQYYDLLKKGFRCKLYRTDGSFKEAVIDVDEEYNFRVYKYPDGEIKRKYVVNVRHIRQFEVEYQTNPDLWNKSVFVAEKGFFSRHDPVDVHCCTIVANSKWGEIHLINIEFNNFQDKILFFRCLSHLLSIFRL